MLLMHQENVRNKKPS
jgi:hypothetical protein